MAASRRLDGEATERVIFAMVANRVSVKPLSKLAGCAWVAERAHIDGLAGMSDDASYRAMDLLLDAIDELQETVFFAVVNLLNLQVDLLFFGTTSTYWQTDRLPAELIDEQDQNGDGQDGSHGQADHGRSPLAQSGTRAYSKHSRTTAPTFRRW